VDLSRLIQDIKAHPRFAEAGMLLIHNGVVRSTARNGKAVTALRVTVDHARLQEILAEHKKRPGILDIRVEIAEDRWLAVGEDVMFLVVAGDVRETVIRTLSDVLDAIKTFATRKTESFAQLP